MSTVSIDHIAMPTANAENLIAFYKKLGFHINDEAEWRAGTAHIFSIQVGDSKINVHPEGYTASPARSDGSARQRRHLLRVERRSRRLRADATRRRR